MGQALERVLLRRRRFRLSRAAARARDALRIDVAHQRPDVLKHLAAHVLARDLQPKLLLDAPQQQQNVERVDVGAASEERRLLVDGDVAAELEIPPHQLLDAGEGVGCIVRHMRVVTVVKPGRQEAIPMIIGPS